MNKVNKIYFLIGVSILIHYLPNTNVFRVECLGMKIWQYEK